MAEISIIIVSFNSRKFISRCLESISRSFKDLEHEIIIVDNGSKDGTIDLLKQKKDIILVQNGKNEGYAKACNQGAKIASGKFLFFANPDIEFEDSIPDKIFTFLSKNKDYAGGGFTHIHLQGKIQRICTGHIVKPLDHFSEQLGLYGLFPSVRTFNARFFPWRRYSTDHPAEFISGGCFLIRKEVFQELSGFDEKFLAYYEDMDFCLRLKNEGYRLFYWGTLRIIHSLGTERGRISPASLKADYASRYYYFKKHYSPLWFPTLWIISNVGLVTRFTVFILFSLYKTQFYNIAKNYFNVFLSHLNIVRYAQ
jgi:GT2 family glycosyltransferase